ncbi:MAG: hypothetical protein JW863_22840 [Chitinispirillaceae bacterium]|nr:hypothetical protein [Chitinispirillaceae bacterium]
MDMQFCHSCAMPIDPATQNAPGNYCGYCTTGDGNLKSREEVTQGIARWMKMWQPAVDDTTAEVRARAYMNGMPAWAAN